MAERKFLKAQRSLKFWSLTGTSGTGTQESGAMLCEPAKEKKKEEKSFLKGDDIEKSIESTERKGKNT